MPIPALRNPPDFELVDGRLVPKQKPYPYAGDLPFFNQRPGAETIPPQVSEAAQKLEAPAPSPITPEIAETAKRLGPQGMGRIPTEPSVNVDAFEQPPQREQPFETQARVQKLNEDRQGGIDKARGMEGIGKGLDKLGRSIAGVGKGSGINTTGLQHADTANLTKDVATAEDKPSGDEIALLEQYGIKVTPGMSATQLNKLFPGIVKMKGDEAQARAAEAGQARSDERFAVSQANQDRRSEAGRKSNEETKAGNLSFRKENLKNTIADRFTKYGPAIEVEKNNNAADSALEQLNSGDPNRQRLALNTLVRLSGDMRLSDEDRRQIQLPMGGLDRLKAQFERGILNKFDPEMLSGLTKVAESYKARVPKIKDRYAREFAHRNANDFLGADEIYGQLSGQYEGPAAGGAPAQGGGVPGYKSTPDQEAAYQKALAEWEAKNAGAK